MAKVSPNLTSQSGVSIVELLVVILVIAIVASLAIISRGSSHQQMQVQNIAYGLKNAFERARFDSVKRRPEADTDYAYVTVNNLAFNLATDRDSDGSIDSGDQVLTNLAGQNIFITYFTTAPQTANMPVTVKFNPRGEPAAELTGGTFISPVFCVSSNGYSLTVLVTAAGTVNLQFGCGGGTDFDEPSVGNIPGTDLINDLVSNLGLAPIPAPNVTPPVGGTPTPTPDPNGTPTPTPDPNGSPTPNPSVTPTATPTGSPNPSPSVSPSVSPTPAPSCALTSPAVDSISYSGNGPQTIAVSFVNGSGNTIFLSLSGGGQGWAISPASGTALGASGTFNATFTYANGNPGRGSGTLTISGCGTKNVTLTVGN